MSVTYLADDTPKSDVDAATADTSPVDHARDAEHRSSSGADADSHHQRPHVDVVVLHTRIERLYLEARIAALERSLRDQRRRNQALIDQYECILEAVTETATDVETGTDSETTAGAPDATDTTAVSADSTADGTETAASDRTESASTGLLARLRSRLR
ncbi:hypothetical protein ACLI4Y_00090 [Natrialbaceae archaeon A-CW3]